MRTQAAYRERVPLGTDATESEASLPRLTVVNVILGLNVFIFLVWMTGAVPAPFMTEHFVVSWNHLAAGRWWVLVTALFSHVMIIHLVINMVVLLSFGAPLEQAMGSGRFLAFYLAAGVTGCLAHAVALQFLMGTPAQAACGASASLVAVLMLFALAFPKEQVLLFFVIPLPAIAAALAFVALDVYGLVYQTGGGGLPIGHGAHLGGALIGIVYFLARGRAVRERESRLQVLHGT
jgi:membrane associated rhomboid family serine protease